MFDIVKFNKLVAKQGYIDEHRHIIRGAAAIGHLFNIPVNAMYEQYIETGRNIIGDLLNR